MKGGVGKTTTSINLAQGLAEKNKKILLVDFDPQANTTDMFIQEDVNYTYIDEILEGKDVEVFSTQYANIDIIPSRLDLAVTEKNILLSTKAQHNRLYKALKGIKDNYDFIIVDCPPILNTLIVNALNTVDEVIIPIKIDLAAQKGFEITLDNIREISESYDLDIQYRILFTMVTRTNIDRDKMIEIEKQCPEHVIQTKIRNQAKPIKEASYTQGNILNKKYGVGQDYENLVDELTILWQ